MTVDWDGKIRMDPSSPYAMARLVGLRDRFDIALGNDADADRHGVVTPGRGLLNPNHVLSAAISYLFGGARGWGSDVGVGKTLVSSSMIDRVVADLGRRLVEVPVGFKWFVDGLVDGSLGFGGEESAGASFLRRDGTVWTTDKDGIIADLLACELTARLRARPGRGLRGADRAVRRPGLSPDRRAGDASAEGRPRAALRRPTSTATDLAGDPITADPDQGARQRRPHRRPQGHDRVGWFAARPSGTENVAKVYAESFRGEEPPGPAASRRRRRWSSAATSGGDAGRALRTSGAAGQRDPRPVDRRGVVRREEPERGRDLVRRRPRRLLRVGRRRSFCSSIALTITRFTVTPASATSRASVRSSASWAALPTA